MTIAFFGTGGTIANRGTEPDNYLDYLDHGTMMSAGELLEHHAIPGPIRVEEFGTLRSKFMTSTHWNALAQRINSVLSEPDIAGVVVAHGTGTMEETAWYLHLTVNSTKPVVVVGAQRPGPTIGSDAHRNLQDAFAVAAHPETVERGVVIVFNRQIHSARDATKVVNHRLDALQSPVRGPLGVLNADHSIEYWRKPTTRHTSTSQFTNTLTPLPRVDVVHAYTDADDTVVNACIAAGATGLIAVGYPPGTMPQPLDDALDQAIAKDIAVVQASSATLEPAVLPRPGLVRRGLITNTDITPAKAKILLQLGVANTLSSRQLQTLFDTY